MKLATHYDNLQVARNASPEVIRAAYKSLTQRYHPDRNANDRARCERVMKIINHAYEVLSDPDRRREHDAWIAREEAAANVTNTHNAAQAAPRGSPAQERPARAQYASESPRSASGYAAAAETFRASRMHRRAGSPERERASSAARSDTNKIDDRPATVPPVATVASGGTGQAGGDGRSAAASPGVTASTPKPGGFLYGLILLLKFGGVLTGLVLYGKLSSLSASVRPESADAWGNMKLHLWLVWAIAVVAYYTAGHLLASRHARSTRWSAMGLIWAGATIAPLFGLLIAPMGLPHDWAVKMPTYYVPKAIRGILFATACTLYLGLSGRVKRTYSYAASRVVQTTGSVAGGKLGKQQAITEAREYWKGAGWSAFAAAWLASQVNPVDHVGMLPAWAVPYAHVGVWMAGVACVCW